MARTVDVRAVDGSVAGSVTLDDAVFGIVPNVAVMHQVVTAQLAAARAGTQSTKTRAEVSGGGKKPFRQKGTGRARQGSTRAPHWAGGGVAFGPKPRSYKQRTPRKMIKLALRSALSDRAAEDRVMVVAEWPWIEPKTALARGAVAALGLDGRVLVVLDRDDDEYAYKSFRNLPLVQVILTGELNAYDVLCNDWIVFTQANLPGERGENAESSEAAQVEAAAELVVADAVAEAIVEIVEAEALVEVMAEVLEAEIEAEAVEAGAAPEPEALEAGAGAGAGAEALDAEGSDAGPESEAEGEEPK